MYCKYCGKKIESKGEFCVYCGNKIQSEIPTDIPVPSSTNSVNNATSSTDSKLTMSYVLSTISAVISIIIRFSLQEMYYTYESIMNNERVYGLDPDQKPLFTIIPIIAGIISALCITSDRHSDSQKKMTAFIINAVIIAVSVLFIWYDIPYTLFDY